MCGDILHVGKEQLPSIEGMFCIQSMILKDLQHYLSTGGTIWMSMVKGRAVDFPIKIKPLLTWSPAHHIKRAGRLVKAP